MGVDGVRLYFDLGLGKLVGSPGYSSVVSKVAHKRGDGGRIEVLFSRDGVAAEIGTPTEMVYVVKADFKATTDPLILANTGDWTLADGVWSAAITGDGAAILTALNGAASGVFKGEFTFTDENGGPTSSQTLAATIYNDVWKGTEGTPLLQPTPDAYVAARALLFDRVQSLTDPQKAQAQANIGIPFSGAVTDNDAKLALTGLADGQQVEITDEGKRLERYTGDDAGVYTSLEIVGDVAYFDTGAGVYHWDPQENAFLHSGGGGSGGHLSVTHNGTRWELNLVSGPRSYAADSAATVHPADVPGAWTMTEDGETGTVDEVNALPEATERNWHTLKNTVYLTVYDADEYGPFEFNGVTVGNGSTVAIGWVPVCEALLVSYLDLWYLRSVEGDSTLQYEATTTTSHCLSVGYMVTLADVFPNGALVQIGN